MKLIDVPFEDLRVGDRVMMGKWSQGTIARLDAGEQLLDIRWDTNHVQADIRFDQIFDTVTYEGEWKMYCVVNMAALKLMKGNRGKLGAQCGHGYQFAAWDAEARFPEHHGHYKNSMHGTKVCLKGEDEDLLRTLEALYTPICGTKLITDAAHTVFDKPTVTVLGIGPIRTDKHGDMRTPELQRDGIAGSILI